MTPVTVTPADTPVLAPVISASPPFVSIQNQVMQHVKQLQGVQGVQVMHPSMLPPPPSPNSLGIRPSLSQEYIRGCTLLNVVPVQNVNRVLMQQQK